MAVHWYHDPADPVRTLIGRCGEHGLPSALLSKTMGGLVGELTEAEVAALEIHAA